MAPNREIGAVAAGMARHGCDTATSRPHFPRHFAARTQKNFPVAGNPRGQFGIATRSEWLEGEFNVPDRMRKSLTEENNDIAQNTATGSSGGTFAGIVTGLASAVALVFSAISLYHSVLKQPELQFYVSPVVHYTRDPGANSEVFAIPLTIANHGARDGAVLDMELTVTSTNGGEPKRFYSAYRVDGDFFVPPGGYDQQAKRFERVNRPKEPFAPISIAGRSNYSATLLFYTKGKEFPKIVSEAGTYDLTLKLDTRLDKSLGMLDDLTRIEPQPVQLRVRLPYFSDSEVRRGGTLRMLNVAWSPAKPDEAGAEPADPAAGETTAEQPPAEKTE
jgi:hypothetical protein